MQSVEITIKGTSTEPMVLVFASTDPAETISERLRVIGWVVRQIDGHGAEPRRRGPRADRGAGPGPQEPPAES
jgi:hypothetical protein